MDERANSIERERRFVVRDQSIVKGAPYEFIVQAYVFVLDGYAIRVRTVQEGNQSGHLPPASRAWLTGKGPRLGVERAEYELAVDPIWATQVIRRCANVIRKRRYQLLTDQTWEVDEFLDANQGLWIAELEGETTILGVAPPAWAASEVTGLDAFNNDSLALKPFATWSPDERALYKM